MTAPGKYTSACPGAGRKARKGRQRTISRYRIVVIGASAGGYRALSQLFSCLQGGLSLPILVAQHLHPSQQMDWLPLISSSSPYRVKVAADKEKIAPGNIYYAPPDYHLLAEYGGTLALSADGTVNYSRPSIDVLFESAAYAWGAAAIGIILTGANHDGTAGLRLIRECGGATIAQDPATAEVPVMPLEALEAGAAELKLTLEEIAAFLNGLE